MPLPTFRPGENTVQLNDVPTFRPTGNRAAAEMWRDVQQVMGQAADNFNSMADAQMRDRQERAGRVAASKPDFDPQVLAQEAQTTADRTFQKGAATAYLARLDVDTDAALADINSQSFGDPDQLSKRMKAHIDSVTQGMPDDIGAQYRLSATRQANAYYTNSVNSAGAKARDQQKTDVMASISVSENALKNLGIPDNEQAMALRLQETAKYKAKLSSAVDAGLLTPQQAALHEQELAEGLQDSTIYHAVAASGDKMAFALNVANGESGTELDQLPVDKRYRAVQVAQQMLNADEAAEKAREKMVTDSAAAQITNAGKTILQAPTDPGARTVAANLLTIASTPEQVDQADKLREYVANPGSPRFSGTNQAYSDYLELQAARGELENRQVYAAWGNPAATTRVNTDQLQKLTAMVEAKPGKIVGTNAWKTYVSKIEAEFPVPVRSRRGMSGLLAEFMNNADPLTASSAEEKTNQRIVTQELLEAQQKIARGDIDSENSLTEYAGKRIAELRQYYGGAGINKDNKRIVPAPEIQAAKAVAQQRPEIDGLVRKYQNDRAAFIRDVGNKSLDPRTANTINRLLKEQK